MKPLSLITGFLPWIAFSLISTRMAANGVAWSALIAVAITIVAMAIARPSWPPKILNVGSAVLFGVIAIVGFVGGTDVDLWLYTWAAPGVGVALGLFVLATVPFMPFTEQYARESTPRAYWGSPTFKKINRVLSLAWGVAITVLGLANIALSALDLRALTTSSDSLLELFLNWVVPIGVIWFMLKFTASYPDKVTGGDRSTGDGHPAGDPAAPAPATAQRG
jgi:hypothetical protein